MEEGPIKLIDPARVPKEPSPLALQGFEWVTMDLTDDTQVRLPPPLEKEFLFAGSSRKCTSFSQNIT